MNKDLEVFIPLQNLIGHQVHFEKFDEVSFIYESFQMNLDEFENVAILYDGANENCRLYIPTFGLDGINIVNENDVYILFAEINSTHHNWLISCNENRPLFPHCNHCRKEIKYNEYWLSGARGNLRLCENCVYDLYPNG